MRHIDVSAATPSQPVDLQITSVVEAGSHPETSVGPREAARIYTGAPIPPQADCIVPFEKTARYDETSVSIPTPPEPASHIRRRGGDLAAGDKVLKVGGRLVMPVGSAGSTQQLTVVEKIAPGKTKTRDVGLVRFVPFTRSPN